ncbi:MAG TPA: hypothetical protein VF865_18590 [Acidobacteriaceae bacterium]
MATFVTSLEAKLASGQIEQSTRKKDRRFGMLLASGLTLLAVAVDGYHPYAEDGGLYAAGVKRLLDPALYPHGTDFVLEPTKLSLFAPVVSEIVRLSHLGLPIVLLALHLASVWATLFAAWMLAERCWPTRTGRAGAVWLLACWLAMPVAGTALFLIDPYLTARSISTPATIFALAGALDMTEWRGTVAMRRRGLLMWLGSIVTAAMMHPLMAAYAFSATLMLICLRSPRQAVRRWGSVALAGTALMLAAWLREIAKPESADYIRIALTRTYWFPAEWRWFELLGLAAPLTILSILASGKLRKPMLEPNQVDNMQRALMWMAAAVGATAWIAALLFSRTGAAMHLVARLQPLRAFQIVYFVMVLALGARLGDSALRRSVWRWAIASVVLGGIIFTAERSTFHDSNHLELPWIAPRNAWVQAFVWIRENTPKDALFALDADYISAPGEGAQCFRATAERSALPDYSKDGGEASIAPELTDAWKTGQAAQQGLSRPAVTDAQRLAALSPIGVSWVVLEAGAATNLDCPFRNAAVSVCHLR